MPQPQTSIWGTILTCVEIGLNIYALQAEHNQGLVVDANFAREKLSEEALKLGQQQGDHIYFDDVKSIVPTYELAQQGAINYPELSEVIANPDKLAQEGRYFAPEYFGEFDPPQDAAAKEFNSYQRWDNGIYLAERHGVEQLAVHQTAGNQVLSDMALHHASGQGDYYFFPINDCSIPVYELSASHPGVLAQIINEDSLLHTLCDDYPQYVGMHNLHSEEWGHIHDCPAPKSLFLQVQLDHAAKHEPFQSDTDTHLSSTYVQSNHSPVLQARESAETFFEPSEGMEW
ncbi:hypothetical protein [Paenibacillus massiliensis]|uniref:hypothetical protein n=1 Tax=Paenibacillus massiliensis TaxID=225917 RepID=UPI000364C5C8|nr:hypothetical protein [Paenibacillus massiliensis]